MMISYLAIGFSRQPIVDYNIPDLFHLVLLSLRGTIYQWLLVLTRARRNNQSSRVPHPPLMISTRNLPAMPSPDDLKRLTQSVAMLDAILQSKWPRCATLRVTHGFVFLRLWARS